MKNSHLPGIQLIISLLLLAFMLSGCDQIQSLSKPSAEGVINGYIDALQSQDYERAYSYISKEDQQAQTKEKYIGSLKDTDGNALIQFVMNQTTYAVNSVVEQGNTAKAEVTISFPDISAMARELIAGALLSEGKESEEAIQAIIEEKSKQGGIPTTTQKETFELIKEEGGWKVYLSLKQKTLFNEATQEFLAQYREWRDKERDDKADEAIAIALEANKTYQAVLNIEGITDGQKERLDVIEFGEKNEKMQSYVKNINDQREYLPKIELYDFKAKYYDTYSDKKVPGVSFKLKNTGDRTVTRVKLIVYFSDKSGQVIYEEDYVPVTSSRYALDNKPLKPGYIWELGKNKFYKAEKVPSEWKEGAAEAKIVAIELEEND
jgi:hypothetical protein